MTISVLISKTAAGKLEMQERTLSLKRSARTLLVLADGNRTLNELLALVQGATPADVEELLRAELITFTEVGGLRRGDNTTSGPVVAPAEAGRAEGASTSSMAYQELYAALNMLCRDHLGLIKGFRYSIEIEKAADVDELRAVAARFVEDVEHNRGAVAGQLVRRALGMEVE